MYQLSITMLQQPQHNLNNEVPRIPTNVLATLWVAPNLLHNAVHLNGQGHCAMLEAVRAEFPICIHIYTEGNTHTHTQLNALGRYSTMPTFPHRILLWPV